VIVFEQPAQTFAADDYTGRISDGWFGLNDFVLEPLRRKCQAGKTGLDVNEDKLPETPKKLRCDGSEGGGRHFGTGSRPLHPGMSHGDHDAQGFPEFLPPGS
jgi:hypothetical protein